MFIRFKKIAAALSTAVLLSVFAQLALAQSHDHSHDTAAPAQLTLNNGQKWTTDDNLQKAMIRIRDALAAQLPAIHANKATAKQYRALAQKVNIQIEFMVQNCKLEPAADAALHLLLGEIIAATDAMKLKQGKEAREGAVKILLALDKYETYFDHPGWHGISH